MEAGTAHALALTRVGRVLAGGEGGGIYGRLGDGARLRRYHPVAVAGLQDAVFVSAGAFHSASIHADGSVSIWGDNVPGTGSDTPEPVSGPTTRTRTATGSGTTSPWPSA